MQRLLCVVLFCLLAAGCSSKRSTFVLLPDPSGKVGSISITNAQGSKTLNEARQSLVVPSNTAAPGAVKAMAEAEIRSLFAEALDIRPSGPEKFLFYFNNDSNQLDSGSAGKIDQVVQAVERRNSRDISINGHADRSGSVAYNYKLSYQRARYIQELLEKRGVDPTIILTTSHGEGNPLVPTLDNVPEPRNRRVEVIVR